MHPVSIRLIERSPERLRPAVRLGIRTVDAAVQDRLPGLAAEIAFWVLLSLPALLLSVIAVTGRVVEGSEWEARLIERIIEVSRLALTERTIDGAVRPVLNQLLETSGLGIASFAFLVTVWTASRAVKVVLQTLAITYDRDQIRQGWHDRLLGFGITLAALFVGLILAPLLIAGPNFGEELVRRIGDDPIGLEALWRAAYYPTTILLAALAITGLYHLGVAGSTPWRRDLPGAVLATAVWLLGSWGLRLYGIWFLGTGSVYGPMAGPIVVLLWIWVSGFAVLLGAELNAQIERLWPSGAVTASEPRVD